MCCARTARVIRPSGTAHVRALPALSSSLARAGLPAWRRGAAGGVPRRGLPHRAHAGGAPARPLRPAPGQVYVREREGRGKEAERSGARQGLMRYGAGGSDRGAGRRATIVTKGARTRCAVHCAEPEPGRSVRRRGGLPAGMRIGDVLGGDMGRILVRRCVALPPCCSQPSCAVPLLPYLLSPLPPAPRCAAPQTPVPPCSAPARCATAWPALPTFAAPPQPRLRPRSPLPYLPPCHPACLPPGARRAGQRHRGRRGAQGGERGRGGAEGG
jgi:hypothetical protein